MTDRKQLTIKINQLKKLLTKLHKVRIKKRGSVLQLTDFIKDQCWFSCRADDRFYLPPQHSPKEKTERDSPLYTVPPCTKEKTHLQYMILLADSP